MRKWEEMELEHSCLNRAGEYEYMFILLGRDEVAAKTVRYWIRQRLKSELNTKLDRKITEAEDIATKLEKQADNIKRRKECQ